MKVMGGLEVKRHVLPIFPQSGGEWYGIYMLYSQTQWILLYYRVLACAIRHLHSVKIGKLCISWAEKFENWRLL